MEIIRADGGVLGPVPASATAVQIVDQDVADISSLAAAPQLETVSIGYATALPDVDVFSRLPALREVSLNVERASLEGVGHPGLEVATLYCQHRSPARGLLAPLERATSLHTLTLMVPGGCDIDFFGSMEALRELSLSLKAPIRGLDGLAPTHLERLTLSLAARATLTPLKRITTLQELTLSSHHKVDLKFLRGLAALRTLDLTKCSKVPALTGLEGASALQTLELDVQRAPNLSPISRLEALEELTLRQGSSYIPAEERPVKLDASRLTGLGRLKALHLTGVKFESLAFLREMPALERLSIAACVIGDHGSSEEILREMPALQEVSFVGAPGHDSEPDWRLPGVTYNTRYHDVDPWGN